jgi:hypothetical protein
VISKCVQGYLVVLVIVLTGSLFLYDYLWRVLSTDYAPRELYSTSSGRHLCYVR